MAARVQLVVKLGQTYDITDAGSALDLLSYSHTTTTTARP
jgi:hypothetical protein